MRRTEEDSNKPQAQRSLIDASHSQASAVVLCYELNTCTHPHPHIYPQHLQPTPPTPHLHW